MLYLDTHNALINAGTSQGMFQCYEFPDGMYLTISLNNGLVALNYWDDEDEMLNNIPWQEHHIDGCKNEYLRERIIEKIK